jgi:hypothetical protein
LGVLPIQEATLTVSVKSTSTIPTGMRTFGFTLTVSVSAMHEESAQKKLSDWLEPSLALKKNSDVQLRKVEVVEKNLNVSRGSEESDEENWDEDFEGVSWDDLGDTDDGDDDDWEDDDDDEVDDADEVEEDDFGLSALKALKSEPDPEEEDDEESEQWGLTW